MTIAEFQKLVRDTYLDKDAARGTDRTFRRLVEETGELARAIRRGEPDNLNEEFGDVFAWLVSLASLAGVELEDAVGRYRAGCPKCGRLPCACAGDD